nr:protein tweety homolog 3-like [Cavia porcellus]
MTMDRYPYVACACKSRADSKITLPKSRGPQGLCQGGVVKGGFWGRLGGSQPGSPHSAVLTLSFTCCQDPLLRVQEVLNGTEVNLQHLTALVDCRSLHLDYVQALTGFCYDGIEGLIYLALFSFVTALMFSSIVRSVPHTWQQKR